MFKLSLCVYFYLKFIVSNYINSSIRSSHQKIRQYFGTYLFADAPRSPLPIKRIYISTRQSFADFNFYYVLIQFAVLYYLLGFVVHAEHPLANRDNVNTLVVVSHSIYPNWKIFLRRSYGDCRLYVEQESIPCWIYTLINVFIIIGRNTVSLWSCDFLYSYTAFKWKCSNQPLLCSP